MKRLLLFVILSLTLSVQAQKKISEYPNTATAAGTDLFILARPSTTTNYNIRYNQLASQIITNISTNLTAGYIPVVGSNLQLSNSIALQTGTNWTLSGSLTTGPYTNATVGDYAIVQSSSTGTNTLNGYTGLGTYVPSVRLHIRGTSATGSSAVFENTTASSYLNNYYAVSAAETYIYQHGSAFPTAGRNVQGSFLIDAMHVGGLQLSAANAGGSIQFWTAGNNSRGIINSSGNWGIGQASPLAVLDVNGGVNIGSVAYDPGANNLSVQGNASVATIIRMTNSTDVAADPAATTGVQWQSTGGWEYRNSVASEGAGQINRVHNRAAQVVGVGTDYSLTQTKTNVTFGTSGGSIALPTAGTYQLHCLANFASTTAADDLEFYLWDSTNNVVVPGSWQHHESHANNDHDVTPLTAIYTVTTNVHIWLGAVNVTAARGVIVSTNTILTYVRCY